MLGAPQLEGVAPRNSRPFCVGSVVVIAPVATTAVVQATAVVEAVGVGVNAPPGALYWPPAGAAGGCACAPVVLSTLVKINRAAKVRAMPHAGRTRRIWCSSS